jgi:hypothetical protein
MNYMQILDRLVSIKSNAHQRAFINLMENPGCNEYHTKADTLESGINGLIMEIQNMMLAEQLLQNQHDNLFLQQLRQFMNEQPAS